MRLASPILGGKFDIGIAGGEAVTAGNQVLADYASQHNAKESVKNSPDT